MFKATEAQILRAFSNSSLTRLSSFKLCGVCKIAAEMPGASETCEAFFCTDQVFLWIHQNKDVQEKFSVPVMIYLVLFFTWVQDACVCFCVLL